MRGDPVPVREPGERTTVIVVTETPNRKVTVTLEITEAMVFVSHWKATT